MLVAIAFAAPPGRRCPLLPAGTTPTIRWPLSRRQARFNSAHRLYRLAPSQDWPMLARKPIFPSVIEMNFQAGEVLGCCVYLVFDGSDWLLIDIGLEETVEEIVELIRQMDFPLSKCKMLIATHADVDHIQGMAKAKQLLKAPVYAHAKAIPPLEAGDKLR